VIKELLIKLNL